MSVSLYGSGQTVIQVGSAWLGTVFSSSSSSYTNITGLSVTLTPQSSTSKFLIFVSASVGGGGDCLLQITRNGTAVGTGSSGSTSNGFGQVSGSYPDAPGPLNINYLDSPSTTSALTYQVQMVTPGGATSYINRRKTDASFGESSSITVLEISGS